MTRPGLSVRAQNLIEQCGVELTPEAVAVWIRASVPAGHNHVARMHQFLRRRNNCGEETALEILAYAFGDELLKRRKIRLACSVCGEIANLQARGETCDKFVQWWAEEHRHPEPQTKAADE